MKFGTGLKPSCSLVVATYNAPQMLRLCLQSVLRQTLSPSEIIIADDGSTSFTKELIDNMRPQFSAPLVHVWHEDEGFRLAAIRNKALSIAKGDYIIQIDGDVILERHFVEDHLRFAEAGYVVLGSRCMLTEEKTKTVLEMKDYEPSIFSSGIKRRDSALRCPLLSPLFFNNRHTVGCNMAFWRKDVLGVNGYDEDFVGWGHEERDLVLRLTMTGVCKRKIKYAAIQYHLWHKEQSKQNLEQNEQRVRSRLAEKVSWVRNGIAKERHSYVIVPAIGNTIS